MLNLRSSRFIRKRLEKDVRRREGELDRRGRMEVRKGARGIEGEKEREREEGIQGQENVKSEEERREINAGCFMVR